MSRKPKYFIYDRREISILVLLGTLVAMFAFTLGVHLGKKVEKLQVKKDHEAVTEGKPTKLSETVDDDVPNRLEISDQAKGIDSAMEEALDESLHEQVIQSGIQLSKRFQTELPTKAKSKNAGATNLKKPEAAKPKKVVHKKEEKKESEPKEDAPAKHEEKVAKTPVEKIKEVQKSLLVNQPTPGGKYTLQIASYPNANEARKHLDNLAKAGMKTFVREKELGDKGRWFRVYIGGYETKKEAEKFAKRYQKDKLIKSYFVAKMP